MANNTLNKYFPLRCPQFGTDCSKGICDCFEKTSGDYRKCDYFTDGKRLDKIRTRIMLADLRVAGEVQTLMGVH